MNKAIISGRPGDLGVGIVGVGLIGQRHANAMRAIHGARLVAVADISKELTARVAKEQGVDACFTAADLVSRKDVDCVIIATNDEAHVEPVAAAASAGKPILLEKPIALAPTISLQVRTQRPQRNSGWIGPTLVTSGAY